MFDARLGLPLQKYAFARRVISPAPPSGFVASAEIPYLRLHATTRKSLFHKPCSVRSIWAAQTASSSTVRNASFTLAGAFCGRESRIADQQSKVLNPF